MILPRFSFPPRELCAGWLKTGILCSSLLGAGLSHPPLLAEAPLTPPSTSNARLDRQRLVSDLDRSRDLAKREYGVDIDMLPVLQRCSPHDAVVSDCAEAVTEAHNQLEKRVEQAKKDLDTEAKTKQPRPVNVTIIDNRTIDQRIIVKPREHSDSRPPVTQPLAATPGTSADVRKEGHSLLPNNLSEYRNRR